MFENLLMTKFNSPPIHPRAVVRDRLIKQLNVGMNNKLTIISAPAGFGKTTLVSMWAKQASMPVAWLSLDEGDNNIARFVTYFVTAIQCVTPNVGKDALMKLKMSQPLSIEIILASLINDLVVLNKPITLFLDDYHLILAQDVHAAIDFLLEFLPAHTHLVIASRSDPHLSISRLRARGHLTELRQENLRFTTEEATSFLNDIMGLELSANDVTALESRTEGWIAGLLLAALSLQRHSPLSAPRSTFVQAFTGSNRYILDYLIEEVLNQQPLLIQEFLLKTSILERMNSALCDAVCGEASIERLEHQENLKLPNLLLSTPQSILEYLEANNLFIVPLDNERQWYRYHHLFSDLLRNRLGETAPEMIPLLHRRASGWYEQHGLMDKAIDHALAGQDFERAITLIEANVEVTLRFSEITTFLNWVEKLPSEKIRDHPTLSFYHAFTSLMSGRSWTVVEEHLQDISKVQDAPEYIGRMAALQAYIFLFKANLRAASESCQKALAHLPESDYFLRSTMACILSLTHLDDDPQNAHKALKDVVRIGQEMRSPLIAVLGVCFQAKLQSNQGNLNSAQEMFKNALEMAIDSVGQQLPIASEALIGLGELEREWNHLETANDLLIEGIKWAKQWSEVAALDAYLPLARIRLAQGDVKGARESQEIAQQIAHGSKASVIDNMVADIRQTHFLALQGDITEALQWAEKCELFFDTPTKHLSNLTDEPDYIGAYLEKYKRPVLARLLILQGKTAEAIDLLTNQLDQVKQLGRVDLIIESQILLALAFQGEGNTPLAIDALVNALSLAKPGNYIRVFVDEGKPLYRLLCQVATRDIHPVYVAKLLKAFERTESAKLDDNQTDSPKEGLIDPISMRELAVLRLMAKGMTNPEIAAELVISVSTVSTHCKNIFSKLNVHKRWDAVKLAQKLSLI